MIRSRDRAADPLRGADRPVLLKGRCTQDRRLVGPGALVDVVGPSVAGDGTLVGQPAGWVVGPVALDDVVFDEWGGGPAVDGEVGVSAWGEGAGVGDCSVVVLGMSLRRERDSQGWEWDGKGYKRKGWVFTLDCLWPIPCRLRSCCSWSTWYCTRQLHRLCR